MSTDNELATHTREQLRPFLNRRIEFEGTVGKPSSVYDHKAKREVPSQCMNNVEVRQGDHPVIDHVWLTWATMLRESGVRSGDVIRFTAQVYDYQHRDAEDHNKFTTRLGIREPRDIKCMNRVLTPPPKEEDEMVRVPILSANGYTQEEMSAIVASLPTEETPEPPQPPADPKRRLLDALWALVEEHGAAKVRKTLTAVEALISDE